VTRDTGAAPSPARLNGAPAASRLVGRYRLVSEQGAGLFGAVWLAEDTTNGQPVAVRLLPRELTDASNVAETIRRRARAVIETSRAHPGLVRVLEYGTTEDGRLFAAMERAEGRRLNETLAGRSRPDVPAALRLAVEMGGPLETLHNMGLLHGAVRPRNFSVADGRVTLMDVETIALRDAPALQHLVAAQSPAEYLAPEQIEGRPVTEKTDVYAFAVTLYEMVSGRPPFEAPTREAVLDKHLNATPPLLRRSRRTVPIAIEATLMEALEKRPEQRPFMPKVLNHVATEAGTGALRRWKRIAAVTAGVFVAVAIAVAAPMAWSVLAPRWSEPPAMSSPPVQVAPAAPAADPTPASPVPVPAPVENAATPPPADPVPPVSAPPAVAAPPAAAVPPVVAVPAPPAAVPPPPSAVPPPAAAVPPPAAALPPPAVAPPPPVVAPPPRAVAPPPPVPRAAAPPAVAPAPAPRAERRERPRPATVPSPAPAAPVRTAPSSASEEPDASAVIDWLLNRRND
jgi:serine/threonine-protein kinase